MSSTRRSWTATSRGVFNGKIFVRQDAQKTDAKQTNKTLLLSDDATINTKPQLEIFADDVKCTHGATVGQLDEEQVFYLRTRGIGAEDGAGSAHACLCRRRDQPDPRCAFADQLDPAPARTGSSEAGLPTDAMIEATFNNSVPPAVEREQPSLDLCRHHFPLLRQRVNGKPLVYFDNAATSQKPQVVIDAILRYYMEENSNIHRGVHYLSETATQAYERVRVKVQHLLNAAQRREIIFVRGTTEGINLVAYSYGRTNVGPGDEVLISAMEHHSNIVPWQILCEEKGARAARHPHQRRGGARCWMSMRSS